MTTTTDISAVWVELKTIWSFMMRTPVQRQMVAFAIAMFLAWLFSDGLRLFLGERYRAWTSRMLSEVDKRAQRRITFMLSKTGFPLLGIAITAVLVGVFQRQEWTGGLLTESFRLFEAVLVYRAVVASLYIVLGEELMDLYHRRLLLPLFTVVLLARGINLLIDLDTVSNTLLFTVSEKPVTLGAVLSTALVVYFLFTGAWVVQHVLQGVIIPRTGAEPGLVNALLTVGRYAVIIIGVSISFSTLGFNMSTITFISGGLSVGIAFGSQQVFGNLAAGILLLFEQSMRPGDIVNVAGITGTVENLSVRSTTLRTPDDITVVIPNQSILTSALRNYSKDSPFTRISVKTTVLHDGDPRDVAEVLTSAAYQTPGVLKVPQVRVFYGPFTKGKVNAELAVWLDRPSGIERITSDLNLSVHDALLASGYEIA